MISEWLVDVPIKVYLQYFHEMIVPSCRNTKHVWDLPLWGHLNIYIGIANEAQILIFQIEKSQIWCTSKIL
jgi:hypothetical protein